MEKSLETQLTPKEIKQIKRYCVLPRLATPSFLSIFLVLAVWLLMVMIDDIGFDAHFSAYREALMYVMLGIVCVLLVVVCCAALIPRFGMNGKKWKAILEKLEVHQQEIRGQEAAALGVSMNLAGNLMRKSDNDTVSGAGAAAQVAGAAMAAVAVHQMTADMARNAMAVVEAWDIPVPKYKKYRRAILLVPVLLMIALHVPEFVLSSQAKEEKKQIVAQTADQLEQAFQREDWKSSKPNTDGSTMDNYHFTSRIKDDPADRYVYITIHEDGVIMEISWHMLEDPSLSREENLEQLRAYVQESGALLQSSGAPFWTDTFETHSRLQGEVTREYLEAAPGENVFTSEEDGNTEYGLSYMVDNDTEEPENYMYYTVESVN